MLTKIMTFLDTCRHSCKLKIPPRKKICIYEDTYCTFLVVTIFPEVMENYDIRYVLIFYYTYVYEPSLTSAEITEA
jgi:hypothetical protein